VQEILQFLIASARCGSTLFLMLHFPKLIRLSGSLCSNTLEVVTVEEQTRSSERKKRSLAKVRRDFATNKKTLTQLFRNRFLLATTAASW